MKKIGFISTSIFIFCFCFYTFSSFRAFDPDLWGHLKFGEFILLNGYIPLKDLYAFVPTKELWINHEWLCEVVFAWLYGLGSAGFYLLLFKAFLFTLAIFIPWYYISRNSEYYLFNAIIYVAIILAFSYGTATRPQVFSYLFFSLTLLLLDIDGLKTKISYIILPIIFILWVNTHGGVLAGLAVVFFYAFYQLISNIVIAYRDKQETKFQKENLKIFILPAILTAALIINPYTYHYYPYIIDAVSMKRAFVDEWGSIFESLGNFMYLNILVLISSIFMILNLQFLNKEKIYQMLLITILMFVSLYHTRHIPFFALACAFYVPDLITCLMEKKQKEKENSIFVYALLFIFMSSIGIILLDSTLFKGKKVDYYLEITTKTDSQYVGYPVESVELIKSSKFQGNMITNFNWGEYIIYSLYPEIKVSFDGRYETVYPEEIVKENLIFINAKEGWKDILNRYNPNIVLLSKYDPVLKPMYYNSGWPLIFKNDEEFMFINPAYINIQTLQVKNNNQISKSVVEK